MPQIETWADVRDFFRSQVADALRSLDLRPMVETETYLVRLLSDFATSERLDPGRPLVELLMDAMDSQGLERMHRMRYLGDAALFLYGFFPETIDRRGVTPSYVVSIGGQAYGSVGADAGNRGAMYLELAEHFDRFGGVLDEVREASVSRSVPVRDVGGLFDRWRRRQSPAVAKRLRELGLFPDTGDNGGQLN